MPLYEYSCRDCGHRFEILQRLGEGAEGLACPSCDLREVPAGHPGRPARATTLVRQFSTFAAGASVRGGGGDSEAGYGEADCGAGAGACCGGGACGMGDFGDLN